MSTNAPLPTKYSKFCQQQLPSWRPILTPVKVMIYFGVMTVVFYIIGALFYISYANTIQYEIRYDDKCEIGKECDVKFDIKEKITGTVFLKYKLTNFYQNHRRFMESRSRSQLAGEYVDYSGMSTCDPVISVNNSEKAENWILPCGISPTSVFNDTFTVSEPALKFNETGIAWKSDIEYNFLPLSQSYKAGNKWLENSDIFKGQTNEHFIVWMRTSAFPTVLKRYAICNDCEIPAGELTVKIQNNYPTSLFDGTKSIVLLKDSAVKSKNNSLGIIYLFLGSLSLVLFLFTLGERIYNPRKLGDLAMIQELIMQKGE